MSAKTTKAEVSDDPFDDPNAVSRASLVRSTPARGLVPVAGVVILLLIALVAFLLLRGSDDDGTTQVDAIVDEAPATTITAEPVVVSDSDQVVTNIPQEPSLRIVTDTGFAVENDGNVTMSNVVVSAADGTVVCELGVISPGDQADCAAAAGASVTVTGDGPQGQMVEIGG